MHNFNYRYLFVKIASCLLRLSCSLENWVLTLKVNITDLTRLSNELKAEWQWVILKVLFELSQQEDVYAARYGEPHRVHNSFRYVALLTLIISVMGLFALISLTNAKETEEIGIQKRLGASAFSVATLLNREFLILISVAGIPFLQLAFVTLKALLNSMYIYRTPGRRVCQHVTEYTPASAAHYYWFTGVVYGIITSNWTTASQINEASSRSVSRFVGWSAYSN